MIIPFRVTVFFVVVVVLINNVKYFKTAECVGVIFIYTITVIWAGPHDPLKVRPQKTYGWPCSVLSA